MQWYCAALSPIAAPGVVGALGASHYVFFKEIPMGSEYVMETRVGGWGEKWLYLITEFVIYPKKGRGKGKGRNRDTQPAGKVDGTMEQVSEKIDEAVSRVQKTMGGNAPAGPSLPGPAVLGSASSTDASTPSPSPSPAPGQTSAGLPKERRGSTTTPDKSAALRNRKPRTDGGVVCCLAITEYCFKAGRVTVPPRIVLFAGLLSPTEEQRARAHRLLQTGRKQAGLWLRGGWKEEPDADTIGSDIGAKDGEGMDWIAKGKEGMEQVVEGMGVF